MYTQIWNKYLPVILILIKRSAVTEQTFVLNRTDFERVSKSNKAGYNFTIQFTNGKVVDRTNLTEVAKALASALLEDAVFANLLVENNYEFKFNTKLQLHIKNCGLQETINR